jgi:hypothetical protein
MKRIASCIAIGIIATSLSSSALGENWTEGMKSGKPVFKTMSQLAFGPEGILFIADTRAAAIVAIATGDTAKPAASHPLKVESVLEKVAALLGTSADQILIDDMAVNPLSHKAYLAVSRGRGPEAVPVLLRVTGEGQLEAVPLDSVRYAVAELPDAPIEGVVDPGRGQRRSNPRQEAITDIAFFQDRLLVAGLSNEEFASTLRAIPFPFKNAVNSTSVEIYHGAHGQFETRAPVRTFVAMNVGDHPSLLAAYTCTPLVEIPISDLKPGAKVRGKTVAELGNRNRPLDMIVYQKDGQDYLLLANSNRGVMKIKTDALEKATPILSRVAEKQGLPYETIADWTGVDHLDKLDAENAVVLRRAAGGSVNLEALSLP